MTKLYRIREFSKLTSVTVRTLQYYDDINLLKPHMRTESSHRLYSEDDILKLQQITTLKFMGFKLSQIKELIGTSKLDITTSLELQSAMLNEQLAKTDQALRLTEQAKIMLQQEGIVDWQTIAKIIEVLTMKNVNIENWVKQFFTKDELDEFKNLGKHYSPIEQKEYGKKWEAMFAEVKAQLDTDPTGEVGQQLAKKWLALVEEVYSNSPKIRQKLWNAFKAGAVPTDFMPYYDQRVIDYIDKATAYYKSHN